MRAFLAVPSDPDWVSSARDLLTGVRPHLPDASWTRPESWHLTVKFLGEIPTETAAAFAEGVAGLAQALCPGDLRARGPVVFPQRGPARVLGVGFTPTRGLEEVRRLAVEAEAMARSVGADRDDRPFHPHVTFARLRRPWPRAAVASYDRDVSAWEFPSWPARTCALYASRLSPLGAVHTPLGEWAFGETAREIIA